MQVMVEDVMTRCPLCVSAQATIDEVLNTLVAEGLSSIYVTNSENRLAGILTDYEILKHQVLGGDRNVKAESLMSRNVPTVRPNESAVALCPKFRDGSFARMAVIDHDGHLIGNLSRRELMRMMLAMDQVEPENSSAPVPASTTQRLETIRVVPPPRGVQTGRKVSATL